MRHNVKAVGRLIVQLEDKQGNVLQRETQENAVTDPFLLSWLARSMAATTLTKVLRGDSKTGSSPHGQYMSIIDAGEWGIYALSSQTPVAKDTKISPYLRAINKQSSDVTFYNIGGHAVETANELISVDSRSGYSLAKGNNTFTLEYVKNTSPGVVRSVIIGRGHTTSTGGVQGVVLGDIGHQPNWITGRAATAVEHKLDRTILWKTSTTSALFLDTFSKEISTTIPSNCNLTSANLIALLNTATTTGAGSVVASGMLYRADYTSATGNNTTITLNRWRNSTTAETKTIAFPRVTGTTYNTSCFPITIYRPDNDTIEIFMAVSCGTFTAGKGANIQKAIISNLSATNIEELVITIDDLGVKNVVPSAKANQEGIGFYDHTNQRYHLPCVIYVDPVTAEVVAKADSVLAPGYVFDSANWNIVGEYFAYSTTAGGAMTPIRTNDGVQEVLYTAATPYYPKISSVISGAVLSQDMVKTVDNVLRIIYSYTLS